MSQTKILYIPTGSYICLCGGDTSEYSTIVENMVYRKTAPEWIEFFCSNLDTRYKSYLCKQNGIRSKTIPEEFEVITNE